MESPWKRRRGRTPRAQTNHVAVAYEKTRDSAAICLKFLLAQRHWEPGRKMNLKKVLDIN